MKLPFSSLPPSLQFVSVGLLAALGVALLFMTQPARTAQGTVTVSADQVSTNRYFPQRLV